MTSSVIRFFEIILRSTLEDGNLKIPNNFTSKFGGALPNPVFLRPPDGSEWKVYWTKQDGEIWFHEGWKEFARYYSMDHGHLVVFEYDGKCSHFDVHIFGTSALEIDYPITQDQIIDDDDSVEILNELPLRQNKRLKGVEKSPNAQDLHQCVQSKGENASDITSLLISTRNATNRALEEAKNFTTENPFVVINILKIHQLKSAVTLSGYFIREYFENKMKIDAMMQLGKKLWPVKLLHYPSVNWGQFSAGWPRFAKESKLRVGDVCIFELINRKDAVFKVHVFRGQT